MLQQWDGISMNKSLSARYFEFCVDQGIAVAQFAFALSLLGGDILPK
jgi:hypothetical protein